MFTRMADNVHNFSQQSQTAYKAEKRQWGTEGTQKQGHKSPRANIESFYTPCARVCPATRHNYWLFTCLTPKRPPAT